MSGGKFDYMQYRIDQVADDVNQQIRRAESGEPDDYGYKLKFTPETIAKSARLRYEGRRLCFNGLTGC